MTPRAALGALGLACSLAVLNATPAAAIEPSQVVIGGAAILFNEATSEEGSDGGTWRVDAPDVAADMGSLRTTLHLQLPIAGGGLEPGPIVLFSGLLLESIDTAGERDILSWLGTPVNVAVARPTCTGEGACAATFEVTAELAAVGAAAAGAEQLSVALAFAAVRTFDEGRLAQVLPPHVAVDDDGGRLGEPDSTYGIFHMHRPFELVRATPAELPGTEPGRAGEQPLDYAAEVRRVLAEPATAALTPDPGLVVRPWTPPPDQPGLAIGFEIDFLAPCPADRVLAVLDQNGQTAHVARLDGLERYVEVVRVPDSTYWQYGLARLDGERLNWQQFDHQSLGGGDGVRVVGTLDCEQGSGSLDVGGSLPTVPIPDPGATAAAVVPSPSPTAAVGASTEAPVPSGTIPVLALAVVAGLAVLGGVMYARRRLRP